MVAERPNPCSPLISSAHVAATSARSEPTERSMFPKRSPGHPRRKDRPACHVPAQLRDALAAEVELSTCRRNTARAGGGSRPWRAFGDSDAASRSCQHDGRWEKEDPNPLERMPICLLLPGPLRPRDVCIDLVERVPSVFDYRFNHVVLVDVDRFEKDRGNFLNRYPGSSLCSPWNERYPPHVLSGPDALPPRPRLRQSS